MDVTPTPSDEEAVAIAAALDVMWPRPAADIIAPQSKPRWRFAGRWWTKPIPLRRGRRW